MKSERKKKMLPSSDSEISDSSKENRSDFSKPGKLKEKKESQKHQRRESSDADISVYVFGMKRK